MTETLHVVLEIQQQTTAVAGTAGDEHYHVAVRQAPGRGWGGPMAGGELETGEIETIRLLYRAFLQQYQQPLGELELHPLRVVGDKLFWALPESVQTRLTDVLAMARAAGKGVTLTLRFAPAAEALLNLPWELLHHPQGGFFLALQGGGVVRQLVLPLGTAVGEPEPQAIVGVWSEPAGVPALALRRQRGPAPGQAGGIQWLQGAGSMRQLEAALASGAFTGVHIVAHGRVGTAWGSFALALTDENGRLAWTTTDQLAAVLGAYPQVRFLYLDVCGSGADPQADAAVKMAAPDAIPGGVARRLLGIGISTVIVMQDVMGQAAAGLLAGEYYKRLEQGDNSAVALAAARRAVRWQQDDVIHWSVPALYRQARPPAVTSTAADWALDRIGAGEYLARLFPFLVLLLLIGRLSYLLAQVRLHRLADWLLLPPLLMATNLLPVLAAAMTAQGQAQLGEKFGLHGRSWLPFLLHKYFSACLWPLFVWLVAWAGWLGVYGAGWGIWLPWWGRQGVWMIILSGASLAAHVGARQAVRQSLLFLRVGALVFPNQLASYGLLLFVLLLVPFVPLVLFTAVWLLYLGIISFLPVSFDLCLGVVLLLLALLLFVQTRPRDQS